MAERDRYRAALTEMACSVGWPTHSDEHVVELQELANTTLGIYAAAPRRDPTPVYARLAYGKQDGAKPAPQAPQSTTRVRGFAGAIVAAVTSSMAARWLAARLTRQ